MLFLSGWDSGLVSSRQAYYRLVHDFSIPAGSLWDQREKYRSRNRGLGIGIRVENGRFRPQFFLGPCHTSILSWSFPSAFVSASLFWPTVALTLGAHRMLVDVLS